MSQYFEFTDIGLVPVDDFSRPLVGEDGGFLSDADGVEMYASFGTDPYDQKVYHLEDTDVFFVELCLNGGDVIFVRLNGRNELIEFTAKYISPIVTMFATLGKFSES